MKGFNFEKHLPHQDTAVNSTIAVFENVDITKENGIDTNLTQCTFLLSEC